MTTNVTGESRRLKVVVQGVDLPIPSPTTPSLDHPLSTATPLRAVQPRTLQTSEVKTIESTEAAPPIQRSFPTNESGTLALTTDQDYSSASPCIDGNADRTSNQSPISSRSDVIHVAETMGGKGKNRKTKWATAAETRAPPKKNPFETDDDLLSDVSSNRADQGDGADKRQRPRGNLVAEDLKLADWSGEWAPAPADWEGRPSSHDARYMERIQEWWDHDVASDHIVGPEILRCNKSDIALHSWEPQTIDEATADEWWTKHLRDPKIEPDSKPFWACRIAPNSVLLVEAKGHDDRIDQEEHSDGEWEKAKIQSSSQATALFECKMLRVERDYRGRRANEKAARQQARRYDRFANPNAPRVNIYIRTAEKGDMEQILEIYNNEIATGITAPEMDVLTVRTMAERWADVVTHRLPFFVAVERSVKPHQPQQRPAKNEYIVGFGLAEDYHDIKGMYRFTVEIEIYVNSNFRRRGIGRCLMDRVIYALDKDYILEGPCDYLGESSLNCPGGNRVVGNVIANVPYSEGTGEKLAWVTKWLNRYGFEQKGDYSAIGKKLNKVVNLAVFYKKTGNSC